MKIIPTPEANPTIAVTTFHALNVIATGLSVGACKTLGTILGFLLEIEEEGLEILAMRNFPFFIFRAGEHAMSLVSAQEAEGEGADVANEKGAFLRAEHGVSAVRSRAESNIGHLLETHSQEQLRVDFVFVLAEKRLDFLLRKPKVAVVSGTLVVLLGLRIRIGVDDPVGETGFPADLAHLVRARLPRRELARIFLGPTHRAVDEAG